MVVLPQLECIMWPSVKKKLWGHWACDGLTVGGQLMAQQSRVLIVTGLAESSESWVVEFWTIVRGLFLE